MAYIGSADESIFLRTNFNGNAFDVKYEHDYNNKNSL